LRIAIAFAFAAALSAADGNWVGSKACAGCHAPIFESFSKTPMAASSGRVTGSALEKFERASFTDRAANFSYRVSRDGAGLVLDFEGKAGAAPIRERRRLDYFVGSGAEARSYLTSVDGFLYEAPAAYYSGPGKWDLPPGYGRYPYPYLTRAIVPGCLGCHASGVQPIAGTQNGYASPPFLEGGVACERCHGPGAAHVAKMKRGERRGGMSIVNPAALDGERRDSICSQCHLAGEVRVERAGREGQTFVAGDKLSDYRTVFVRAGDALRRKVTSHVENLAQSACKRASGDKLWCGTCHDPHSAPRPEVKASWYRAKCLTCHAAADCTGRGNRDDCVTCHMPRNAVTDAEHVVYTDHSIRRRPTAPVPPDTSLVAFGEARAERRDLGLAYAIVGPKERAFELLKGAADAQALAYLAELYKARGDDRNAPTLYKRALALDPNQVGALAALGAYRMEAGDYAEAIRLWNAALTKSPALVLVRVNLAEALTRAGRKAEAAAVLRKAREFNPALLHPK
jgi:predicted CXXCH cytochrome family protein